MVPKELNEREKKILRYIIQQFVLTASPVGSRNITKKYNVGLSPASVRNIMSDLEDFGYVDHPHTSAGRVPTDKGYRTYVDSLINIKDLKKSEKGFITQKFENTEQETNKLLKLTSQLLSKITNQLACVCYPSFNSAILSKIQIVRLSSELIMVVVSIKSGMVKTITLELSSEIKENQIKTVERLLNERLTGLLFKEIKKTFAERFKDIKEDNKAVIRIFIDSADKIFTDKNGGNRLVISGVKNVLKQPEFLDSEKFQGIIELLEDEEVIIHIFEKESNHKIDDIHILIGDENQNKIFEEYSLIKKNYNIGNATGTLGIIGPKRMEYSRIITIVDYMSKLLSQMLTNRKSI